MPKTRQQKEQDVTDLVDKLKRTKGAVITDYHGLTVRDTESLRSKLREQGMDFEVVKNTLFKRAADEAGITLEQVTGPAGIAFGYEDAVQTAKIVSKFAKANEKLEIVGGVVEGRQVDVAVIKKLSSLPSREELLGRLVGSLSTPTRNLASVLSATTRNLVYALRAVQESKA